MSKFLDVDYMLEAISMTDPSWDYVEAADVDRLQIVPDEPVAWAVGHYGLWVRSDNIRFMPENLWYPGHAAALVQGLVDGSNPILESPAARIHRVSPYDVESTQAEYSEGTLEEESGMSEPWTSDDIGQYKATLVDGNHRAAAAMSMGLQRILVTVGENYRENVDPGDWVKWR